MTENAFYAPYRRTIWDRLGFGLAHAYRDGEEVGMAPGCIIVNCMTVFDWKDRLRILVTGRVSIQHAIATDVAVMRSHSTTSVAVAPPEKRA